MKIYYDTEFNDDGEKVDLISIGMVREDGREYYAINDDADWLKISLHPWLPDNVVKYLPTVKEEEWTLDTSYKVNVSRPDRTVSEVKPKWVIANEVRDFILSVKKPELWAYYSAHDHVALSQLWGPMVKMPKGIPWRTNDLQQEIERLGNPALPPTPNKHHALADARWNRLVDEFLETLRNDG